MTVTSEAADDTLVESLGALGEEAAILFRDNGHCNAAATGEPRSTQFEEEELRRFICHYNYNSHIPASEYRHPVVRGSRPLLDT